MDPITSACDVALSEWPAAGVVILGGSSATLAGDWQPSFSDLDIVVVGDGLSACARTLHHAGVPVEAFVCSPESLPRWWRKDIERGRAVVLRMCAEGLLIRDIDGTGSDIQQEAAALLHRGPRRLTQHEADYRRYRVTSLLDDLHGVGRPDEVQQLIGILSIEVMELTLLHDGQWVGVGKWLARRFAAHVPEEAERLASATQVALCMGETAPYASTVGRLLQRAGGQVSAGFSRTAVLPG